MVIYPSRMPSVVTFLFTLTALALLWPSQSLQAAPRSSQSQVVPSKNQPIIVLAIDGLSYYAFQEAQKQGLFKGFKVPGAHVAPFPTMTDLSWAVVTHTAELFGAAGRIKSVEATYFDESTQSIQGDPRDYYRRLAFPKYYLGAFDAFFNPYVEALVYFPTEEVPKLEFKSVIDDLIAAKPKKVLTGYVGSVDSTAHTQKGRLFPLLKTLDAEVRRLSTQYKSKGQDIEIVLISDHGNIGRFAEGQDESELIGIEIADTVKRSGLNFVHQLRSEKDVAMPLLALGSWAPVYLKDRRMMTQLIAEFRKEKWFDLAVYLNSNNSAETIMTVVSAHGHAKISYDKIKDIYAYHPAQGNPLHLDEKYHSNTSKKVFLDATQAAKASLKTPYPDALYRLIESASERNFDFPDLILTVQDGYYIKNSLDSFAKMYRTHGSLTGASSFGLVVSNKRNIPAQVRSKDLLPFLGINVEELFADSLAQHRISGQASLNKVLKSAPQGIETHARDFNQKRVFRHLSKFIADTRPYFQVDEMKSFMEAFKFNPFKDSTGVAFSPLNFDMSKFDVTTMLSPEDIGIMTDVVLTSDSLETVMDDPRMSEIKDKVGSLKSHKLANLTVDQNPEPAQESFFTKFKQYILPGKRAVMKMYQMPYLLENSLVVQEKPFLQETRDLRFARHWVENKPAYIKSYTSLTGKLKSYPQLTTAQMLFKEALKESDIEDRIYPTILTKIYNQKIDELTIVYVPGIYNSIFDREIFSLGLNALTDDLGLRVIQPPVESSCDSQINGDIILNFLSNDLKSRRQRGHKDPRYLFISYSKGAIDTLYAFTKNPRFVSTYVKGLVTVAAPLHGSSILNTTSLPFDLVDSLTEGSLPKKCKEASAAKSITPTAMDAFWRRNERGLIGLTRYFSVTFESAPENSHIFMKATKLIGQFNEDNDGVVTVSSSKFPSGLSAVDLGTLNVDHLAGILSSRFNQKAFMKGLINTLAELDINNTNNNLNWNSEIILNAANKERIREDQFLQLKKPGLVQVRNWRPGSSDDSILFSNTWELNLQVLPKIEDPAFTYEVKTQLPPSTFKYDPYFVLDVSKLPGLMASHRVTPISDNGNLQEILIRYSHKNVVHFRMDHQFNYESRSPVGVDNNDQFGYVTADFQGEKNWALLRSVNNSIRMTTMAYRFSPLEYPHMSLKLAITKDVEGADPVKGKTGKDDSPFQIWFTIRDGHANGDRSIVDIDNDKVMLFGYYYGGSVPGENRRAGDIFENWYSNKNVIIAVLPEAKQLLLNNPEDFGKAQLYQRNLAEDLVRAFPDKDIRNFDIVAITLQHDSNDTKSSSETYFKELSFGK